VTVLAVDAYSIALAAHIMAVVAGFGLPMGYPLLVPYVKRTNPTAMPAVHDVQLRLNRMVTAPALVIIFILGGYMANDADVFGEIWVIVPLVILVVIGGVGGAIINPTLVKLIPRARADVDAAGSNPAVTFSADYEALYAKYLRAEQLLGVLVLVAIFFMAAKP
jgi:uncharacterized membrane protein